MTVPAISCNNVTFSYFEEGKEVLKNTALEIPQGRITVLMGSSGCGKSTLAAVLCGLLPDNGGILKSGEILLYGRSVKEIPVSERARSISMMFQNPDLQFCMPTLREELIFCAENISISPDEMDYEAERAASQLGTTHLLDRPLHTLSGGEKQRAVLTCIALLNSKCIVLDESFANLDPASVSELLPVLSNLCHKDGKTILAIDHMSDHWKGIADRYVLIGEGGTILCEAETQEELEAAKPIFTEEGIAYPGIWEKKTLATESSTEGLHFCQLTIPQVPAKKKLFGKATSVKPEYDASLYYEADAHIPDGKITAIMGPSGCGKTSLMMTLLKQRDYFGNIEIRGDEIRELRDIKAKDCFKEVGIAFQNPSNQFVTQNVLSEVLDGLKRRYPSEPEEVLKEKGLALLDTCGLRKYHKYSPYMLSQGQQRRLAVLAVIAAGQKLLLLDEPTYGQDYKSARALMDLIAGLVKNEGLTVIMSTHDAGLAGAYADVILHVKDKKFTKEVR